VIPVSIPRHSRGISLVELLIALTLSLVIGIAVTQMFLASKTTYRLQEAMARVQENGRFAVNFLAGDIRMAGFMGCGNISEMTISVIANPAPIDATNPLGQVIGGQNNVSSSNTWSAVSGTDVLSIRRASNAGVRLVGNMETDNANIQIEDNRMGLLAGDTLFLADCVSADIFRATNVSSGDAKTTVAHANNFNTSNKLSKAYGADAEVLAFLERPARDGQAPGDERRDVAGPAGLDGQAREVDVLAEREHQRVRLDGLEFAGRLRKAPGVQFHLLHGEPGFTRVLDG